MGHIALLGPILLGKMKTVKLKLPENSTVKDLRQIARFNRIIKNYLKMKKIQKKALAKPIPPCKTQY